MGNVSKQKPDIRSTVQRFAKKVNAFHRYASWEYCHAHFLKCHEKQASIDCDLAALNLGFYLASWGMFRGSSFLLQKSAKYFQPTIEYIATLGSDIWKIDVDKYNEQTIEKIIVIYSEIKSRLILNGSSDLTLVTKVMLGVFGFIPAFDSFFCNTFRSEEHTSELQSH